VRKGGVGDFQQSAKTENIGPSLGSSVAEAVGLLLTADR